MMFESHIGLAISYKKNYSAEDGIPGPSCFVEKKTLGIPFRIFPWKRKMLGIP
jgi:hypothetical protein